MYCLSSLGFFIIFFSLFLFLTVPTKLSSFSRFVIHGHDLMTGLTQVYMTVGIQTYVILPCASGYNAGILSRFEVISTTNQLWILIALFSSSAMFSLLLGIHRVFAISMSLSEKTKNILLKSFFLQWFLQIIGTAVVGLRLKDAGEKGRTECIEKVKEYPIEMDTLHGVNFMFTDNIEFMIAMIYVFLYIVFYMVVACICGTVLVISIRDQGKSSQSAQFLANQRRITVGIIYFGVVELVGVGVPVMILAGCSTLHVGNYVVAHFSFFILCSYPISGPYYILMSNVDYSKRVDEIMENVCPKLSSYRSSCSPVKQSFVKSILQLVM